MIQSDDQQNQAAKLFDDGARAVILQRTEEDAGIIDTKKIRVFNVNS